MSPLVTVVIPSYNCEAYIAETVDSVLAQHYKNIELLVVDDGSTDNTQPILRKYGDRLRLIVQENQGVCVARNRGIREAAGQFICFMDHDDYWYPDKISRQVQAFQVDPKVGLVYSDYTMWYADADGSFPVPDSLRPVAPSEGIDHEFSGWIYHLLLLKCWVLTSTAMLRVDVFKDCGVFNEDLPYSEDWDLWLRLARRYPFIKLNACTTLYRQHARQGNKKVRPIDYRTVLLAGAKRKWGLASPDGRSISRWHFNHNLADCHAAFGLHHLQVGNRKTAVSSLIHAWRVFPIKVKYIAYILASCLGWRPTWHD